MTTILPASDIRAHNDRLNAIERIVDAIGLTQTVGLLAEIASAKADHIRHNWQDEPTAKAWDRDAAALLKTADKLRTS